MVTIREGTNRPSPSEAGSFVDKFEELEAEIASERGTFMAKCKAIREQQKELLDDAKSKGIAKKMIKGIVKARYHEEKAREIYGDLDDDDKPYFIDTRKALGDDFSTLPLGIAAIERDEASSRGVDPIAAHAQAEWDKADPKNKAAAAH